MGRLAWYAGISTALAGGVIISAFNQRANFYSAFVYLAQSNLCLMILINLILLVYGGLVFCLQRLCYGPLRPIEVEQLYEKAWFAITETCLAMTIFREEVGAWFLVMFVALLTGKVWGWIGEGRVEVLEQQPPANPRLFHIRLSISLASSVLYDVWLMNYTINTVIQQARPNMMVMFLFEFAVLTTSSFSTAFRYCISLAEANVIKKQTQDRLIERRREVREERAEILRQREAAAAGGEGSNTAQSTAELPSEEDVDEMDIEVPGWDAKGQFILTLDLVTDFVKLGIYMTFFFILLTFYGLPIHIMRDLFVTARSFLKRLTAFLRYRQATQDMNTRYEDASAEDIRREDTCIICREEMRPWPAANPQAPAGAPGAQPARPATTVNERSRPKKLPCGHILHLGCLKSWLERQQVCPTCRRSVVENPRPPRAGARAGAGQAPAPGHQDGAGAAPGANGQGRGMRMLNLGPLRLGFGQGPFPDLDQGIAGQAGNQIAGGPRVYGVELGFDRRARPQGQATAPAGTGTIQEQLRNIEQQIAQEIRELQMNQQELQLTQLLQAELTRLRGIQNDGSDALAPANFQLPTVPHLATRPAAQPQMQRHTVRLGASAIPSGSSELPPGVSIPEGWSLLPLQRTDGLGVAQGAPGPSSGPPGPPFTGTRTITSPLTTANDSNINASTVDAANQPRPSEEPSTANNIPTSVIPDQSASSAPAITSATTPIVAPEPTTTTTNPTALPNWGSSQLFSGANGNPATTSTNGAFTTPPLQSEQAAVPGPSSSAPADESQNDEEAEERRRLKGKGRAATVEDTEDEADL